MRQKPWGKNNTQNTNLSPRIIPHVVELQPGTKMDLIGMICISETAHDNQAGEISAVLMNY